MRCDGDPPWARSPSSEDHRPLSACRSTRHRGGMSKPPFPDAETMRAALSLAVRAPSVHNSQPWLWRVGPHTVHLYADPDLHLTKTDPDQRDLMLSCGIALNHCVVALAALGWQSKIHRFPNPSDPNHVAAIELHRQTPAEIDVALAAAIPRRRTDRRNFSRWTVPNGHIALMAARAARSGVKLLHVVDTTALKSIVQQAVRTHVDDDDYLHELTAWSGRHASLAGVPARNTTASDPTAELPSRAFAVRPLRSRPTRRRATTTPSCSHSALARTTSWPDCAPVRQPASCYSRPQLSDWRAVHNRTAGDTRHA